MNAILAYIQRFVVDNHKPQTRLIKLKVIKGFIETLENDALSELRREQILDSNWDTPPDVPSLARLLEPS